MKKMRKIFFKDKEIAKKNYRKELERVFSFNNLYELMQSSILQLVYKHPGVFRFKQPIPKIFIENVKYTAPSKKYFMFPIEEEEFEEGLKGLGASAGKVKGEVFISSEANKALKKVGKYEILVCPKTDPSWMPVLNKVSGVITEGGGLLSHAAIVCRELKIPCIVGVRGALKKLKDGDKVKVDAEEGKVEKLD